MKGKIHEETYKQFCFVEIEVEGETEEEFIETYLRVLKEIRLRHIKQSEEAEVGKSTVSEKQLETIRRLCAQKKKKLIDLLNYIKDSRAKNVLQLKELTKSEASSVIELLKGGK